MGKYQKYIEAARQISVVQYLETYRPGELVRKTDREYCTRSHDSLIITIGNGKFHWYSHDVGGNNAIDYLTKVEGMDFVSAVRLLNEMTPAPVSVQLAKTIPVSQSTPRKFEPPAPDRNAEAAAAYLMQRGISPKVLRYCVGSGILYQTTRGNYRNCVFVGKDENGVPHSAFQRGCQGSFRGDVAGSQKQYGFLIPAESEACDTVEIYEAPIDLGYEGTENGATISDLMESVIKDEKPPEVVIHHEEKVDFIPSDIGLSDMEVSLVNVMAHEKIMEQALEPFKDKYDYCLIDCMPSLGIITVASLVAADRVLIPVQAQHFALKGLVSLFKSVNQVKRRINPRLDIDGIVLTMVDKRTNLSKDVGAALRSAYGHALKIYRAEIPVSTRTAESAASTHSVLTYDANGPASLAYKALAKEVTENERVRQQHQSALAR